MIRKLAFAGLIVALCTVCLSSPGSAASYKVHYLGVLPGTDGSCAVSINNSGQATGFSASATDMSGVFLWDKEAGMKDIRVPGSLDSFGGINNLGQVVGSYSDPVTISGPAVREPDGTIRKIANTMPYPYGSGGNAINDVGQIAGHAGLYAAIWQDDTIIWTADSLFSQANAINNNGAIVWTGHIPDGAVRAYSKELGKESKALSLLYGTDSCWANAINDLGQIVGYSGRRAVLWRTDGTVVELAGSGPGFGWARDINSQSWIVGQIGGLATLWNPEGNAVDLSQFVGGYQSDAYSINDNGWIAGYVDSGGLKQAVIWEPVPEPSSVLALLCGIGGLAGYAVRRRAG